MMHNLIFHHSDEHRVVKDIDADKFSWIDLLCQVYKHCKSINASIMAENEIVIGCDASVIEMFKK